MVQTKKEAAAFVARELTDEQLRIMSVLNDPDADPAELKDTLELVELRFLDGVDFIGDIYEAYGEEIDALKKRIDRLTALKKQKESAQGSIKWHMLQAMLASGRSRVEGSFHMVSTRKSQHVEITGQVPEKYLRYKDPEPDKKAISELITKQGGCEFAQMVETVSLTVR